MGGAFNDPRDGSSDVALKSLCPKYCPENLVVCPGPPTGCSYGEAPKNKCGCQTACPPVDCPSATKTMTNFARIDCDANDCVLRQSESKPTSVRIDDDDDPMDIDFPDDDDDDDDESA